MNRRSLFPRIGPALVVLLLVSSPMRAQSPPASFYQNIDFASNLADLYEWLAPFITEASARRGAATALSKHLDEAGRSLRWGGQPYAVIGVPMKRAGPSLPPIPWGEPTYYGTGSHPAHAIAEHDALTSTIRPAIGDLYTFAEESSFYIIATLENPADLESKRVKFGVVRHPFATALRDHANQLTADSEVVRGILEVKQDQVTRYAMEHAQQTAKDEVQRANILETRIGIESQRQKVVELERDLQNTIASIRKADAFLGELRLLQGILTGSAFLGRLYNEFSDVSRTELDKVQPTEEGVTVFVKNYKSKKEAVQVEWNVKVKVERDELKKRLKGAQQVLKDRDAPIEILELFLD